MSHWLTRGVIGKAAYVCVCDVAQPCAQNRRSSVTWCRPLWELALSRSMRTKMAAALTAPLHTKYFRTFIMTKEHFNVLICMFI